MSEQEQIKDPAIPFDLEGTTVEGQEPVDTPLLPEFTGPILPFPENHVIEDEKKYQQYVDYYFNHTIQIKILELSEENQSRCNNMREEYSTALILSLGYNLQTPEIFEEEFVIEDQVDFYRHIQFYFDTQVGSNILKLKGKDQDQVFGLLRDYSDILNLILIPGIDIIEHVLGQRFGAANDNPHDGIDFDYNCPIIGEYEKWKAAKK